MHDTLFHKDDGILQFFQIGRTHRQAFHFISSSWLTEFSTVDISSGPLTLFYDNVLESISWDVIKTSNLMK